MLPTGHAAHHQVTSLLRGQRRWVGGQPWESRGDRSITDVDRLSHAPASVAASDAAGSDGRVPTTKDALKVPAAPRYRSALAFYEFGCRSLRLYEKRLPYGRAEDVTPAGIGVQAHRDARLLASTVKPAEIRQYISSCERHRIDPTPILFIRLLAAPRDQWDALIKWMAGAKGAGGRRSTHDLVREILARYPHDAKRKKGRVGRRPRAITTEDELRVELHRCCDRVRLLLTGRLKAQDATPAVPTEWLKPAKQLHAAARMLLDAVNPPES